MRKMTNKNKSSFIIFSIVVILVVSVVGYMRMQQIQASTSKEYPVNENSVVYDKKGDYIDVSSNGKIKKEWTNSYQMYLNNKSSYDLGDHAVVRSGSGLSIYGSGYRVFDDGSIKTLPTVMNIQNLIEPSFYKLQDRKYLLIGNDIRLKGNGFQGKGYVLVDLDKAGNAFLRNDKVNFKVVAPVVLTNGPQTFDVANEMLSVGKVKTNLKKINGSTNEYEKIANANALNIQDDKANDKEKDNKQQGTNTQNGTSANGAASPNSPVTNTNGGGTNGNSNASGNANGLIIKGADQLKETINKLVEIINNTQGNNDTETKPDPGQKPNVEASSLTLNGLSVGVNSLTADYYVSDAGNTYSSVYLKVLANNEESSEAKTIQLNKNETRKQVYGLSPNKSYEITLGYIDQKGKENIVDSSVIRTKNITGELYVKKVVNDTIYFNLKLDGQFKIDSAKLVVYDGDSSNIDVSIDADVNAAASKNGWDGSVQVSNTSADSYKLTLEHAVYEENGVKNEINLNIETVVKNTWLGKLIKSIFG